MRLAVLLLALLIGGGMTTQVSAGKETGGSGGIIVYNAPEDLFAIHHNQRVIPFRSLGRDALLGANALAAIPGQQLLVVDRDGIAVYRMSRGSSGVSDLTISPVGEFQDFLLRGMTRDERFFIVRAKKEFDDTLIALPVTGKVQDKRKLPINGSVAVLPALTDKTKEQRSLLGLLKYGADLNKPADLLAVDITSGVSSQPARLPNVLAAAWRRAPGKLIAVLAPKYSRQLHLPGNLVEWEFGKGRIKALGRGMSFTSPVIDGGDYIVSGMVSSTDRDTHKLAIFSRKQGGPVDWKIRHILEVQGEPSNIYISANGQQMLLLVWPKPKPNSITRWARLISYDLETGKVKELAHKANQFAVMEN